MSNGLVVVEGASKRFRRGELHDSLRDLIPTLTRRLSRKASQKAAREFWALRDISFMVKPGDALGIIGPNGAGKSTLLKLLTRILRPTTGFCQVRGRVGALIEIAAGFHPDLTGRENVYLQGAIMGMTHDQVRRRFDEIVEFSGVADFIDTPIKRYSSGMNARLGFAIAAHLEPDVLIIDEVLSVGDHSFQSRAFGRIKELATQRGVPVVVVSHQLDKISTLCTQALLLNQGRVVERGTPAQCISAYISTSGEGVEIEDGDRALSIESVHVVGTQPVASGGRVRLIVRGDIHDSVASRSRGIAVRIRALHTGEILFATDSARLGLALPESGDIALDVQLNLNVPPGLYAVETYVENSARRRAEQLGPTATLQVTDGPAFLGRIQMNPTMRFASSAETAIAGGGQTRLELTARQLDA